MAITSKDLQRLSAEVRRFINKADNVETRFGTTPTLTFEFSSYDSLGYFMHTLNEVVTVSARVAAENGLPWRQLSEGIYELSFGGIRIVLMHVSSYNAYIKD